MSRPARLHEGTVQTQLLDPMPILGVFVVFAVITLVCYEVGFHVGRWWQARMPGDQEGPTDMLVGSLLALMAFLLAITMGMAADRFDQRRANLLAFLRVACDRQDVANAAFNEDEVRAYIARTLAVVGGC